MAEAFAVADLAKPHPEMQSTAGFIARNDLSLQRPIGFSLRDGNQRSKEGGGDPLSANGTGHVDADLSNPGSASGVSDRCKCTPADDTTVLSARDQPSDGQVRLVPLLPDRRRGHEGRQSGRQSFSVDGAHLCPILAPHWRDRDRHWWPLSRHPALWSARVVDSSLAINWPTSTPAGRGAKCRHGEDPPSTAPLNSADRRDGPAGPVRPAAQGGRGRALVRGDSNPTEWLTITGAADPSPAGAGLGLR